MPRSTKARPTTVLIVENEAMVRLELAAQLGDMGLIVYAAGDADEAIMLLDAHAQIRLLLTDIRMPGSMDGLRLAHHVRNRWPPVRIMVISGLADTELSQLPDDSIFLSKPYRPEGLADALAHMMEGGGPRTQRPSARGAHA